MVRPLVALIVALCVGATLAADGWRFNQNQLDVSNTLAECFANNLDSFGTVLVIGDAGNLYSLADDAWKAFKDGGTNSLDIEIIAGNSNSLTTTNRVDTAMQWALDNDIILERVWLFIRNAGGWVGTAAQARADLLAGIDRLENHWHVSIGIGLTDGDYDALGFEVASMTSTFEKYPMMWSSSNTNNDYSGYPTLTPDPWGGSAGTYKVNYIKNVPAGCSVETFPDYFSLYRDSAPSPAPNPGCGEVRKLESCEETWSVMPGATPGDIAACWEDVTVDDVVLANGVAEDKNYVWEERDEGVRMKLCEGEDPPENPNAFAFEPWMAVAGAVGFILCCVLTTFIIVIAMPDSGAAKKVRQSMAFVKGAPPVNYESEEKFVDDSGFEDDSIAVESSKHTPAHPQAEALVANPPKKAPAAKKAKKASAGLMGKDHAVKAGGGGGGSGRKAPARGPSAERNKPSRPSGGSKRGKGGSGRKEGGSGRKGSGSRRKNPNGGKNSGGSAGRRGQGAAKKAADPGPPPALPPRSPGESDPPPLPPDYSESFSVDAPPEGLSVLGGGGGGVATPSSSAKAPAGRGRGRGGPMRVAPGPSGGGGKVNLPGKGEVDIHHWDQEEY